MEEKNKEELAKRDSGTDKTLLLVDTEKIKTAITDAVKPLVELWIEKNNETEQLRITKTTDLEIRKLDLEEKNLNHDKLRFNVFVFVFITTVTIAIVLETVGKFTLTTGIIVTAVLTLSGSYIATNRSKTQN